MLSMVCVCQHTSTLDWNRTLHMHAHTHIQSLSIVSMPHPRSCKNPILPPSPQPAPSLQREREEKRCLLSLLEPMHPMVFSQRPWIQAWKCYPDTVHSPSSSCDSLSPSAVASCSPALSLFLSPSCSRSITRILSLSLFLSTSLPPPPSIRCSVLEEMRLVSQYAWGN